MGADRGLPAPKARQKVASGRPEARRQWISEPQETNAEGAIENSDDDYPLVSPQVVA